MSYRLGIDVGGTFTDFLVLGDAVQLVHKTSSTPHDPSEGFVRGLEEIADRLGVPFPELMASIDLIVPATAPAPARSRPTASATPCACATARAPRRTTTA